MNKLINKIRIILLCKDIKRTNLEYTSLFQEIHIHPKAQKGVKGHVGSPMPGSVIEVQVKVGQKVEKGAPLIVISAMKMEMVVQAPIAGTVKSVEIKPGMKVEGDDLLVTIE